MSSPAIASVKPLPLGQVLYAIHDTAVISVPKGAGNAQFHRLTFTGTDAQPVVSVQDPLELAPLNDIRDARSINDLSGTPGVAILSKTGLSIIRMSDGHLKPAAVPAKVDDALLVIGVDPVETTTSLLALLVSDGGGSSVAQVDLSTGQRRPNMPLPPGTVRGRAVATELVRSGSSMMLAVLTIDGDSLVLHTTAWEHLAPNTEPKSMGTLTLGKVYTLAQEQYKAADARDTEVAAIATSMRARTVDQQLAVAWPETRDTSRVALVGWGNDGQPVLLDAFASTWAYFTDPICRLAAADILHLGADQLVYANSADWGGGTNCDYYPEYAHYYHCAALTLFTLDESVPSAPKLKCESKYVLGDMKRAENPYYDFTLKPSKDYYEYVDLHIAAGVFGTCMGVQVIGLRGLEGGGFAPTCGFIPVDPASRSFPAMPGEIPIPPKPWYPPSSGDVLPQPPQFYRSTPSPNWCAGAGDRGQFLPAATDVNRILAFPTSLNGESIVLGAPEVKSLSKCGQILAIIQAHPFHGKVANSTPSVGFSTTTNESKGLSISTDKSWTLSDDTSVNLGLGGLSLSQATHNSFLRNLTHSADSSYSNSVHLQTGITHEDHLLVSEINYNVWRYPVLRYSGKNKPGEMLVVFPLDARPHTAWISARKYGYRPRWEVGMLFSYINVPKDGYAPENELCSLTEYEVGQNLDTSSQSFDLTESDSNSEGRHLGIQQGVSQHAGLTASTELFDCLPVSFGFNIGTSHSYSTNKIETTHLNVHKGLSLSVNSGSVKKDMYSYTVRPVVYRHSRLGCLVLAWDVSVGDGWDYADASFRLSEVVLIRPTSSTDSPVYDALSRSLSFVEQNDRITGVTAEIFVNGRTSIRDKVFCEFFDVTSKFASGPPADLAQLTKPEHSLGKVQANDGELKPLERRVVTLSGLNLPKPAWVAVRLFIDEMAGGVYWNVHPPERFFHS